MKTYIPISCSFYDQLEDIAVRKIKSKIIYLEDNSKKIVEDYIVDFKNINKEEFLVLSSGDKIRLDMLIEVNNIKAPKRVVFKKHF